MIWRMRLAAAVLAVVALGAAIDAVRWWDVRRTNRAIVDGSIAGNEAPQRGHALFAQAYHRAARGEVDAALDLYKRAQEQPGPLARAATFNGANIHLRRKRLPLTGVFAVTVSGIDTRPLPGAASLGVRPTLADGLKPVLEVHLLDFDRPIYGAHVTVNFLHKLRAEKKYDSLDALTAQIARDVAAVRTYFSDAKTQRRKDQHG